MDNQNLKLLFLNNLLILFINIFKFNINSEEINTNIIKRQDNKKFYDKFHLNMEELI